MIEPCLKFYAVPSPFQYMALRSRSQTLNFLCLIFTVSVSAKPWLIWIMFGMNRYKILKCFIKEKHNCRRAFLSGGRSYFFSFILVTFCCKKSQFRDVKREKLYWKSAICFSETSSSPTYTPVICNHYRPPPPPLPTLKMSRAILEVHGKCPRVFFILNRVWLWQSVPYLF